MNGDGEIHIYLGTSAWVAASSRTKTKFKHGAAAIQSADPEMNLICGITEAAGSNIQWICDQFFAAEQKELGDGIYAVPTLSPIFSAAALVRPLPILSVLFTNGGTAISPGLTAEQKNRRRRL